MKKNDPVKAGLRCARSARPTEKPDLDFPTERSDRNEYLFEANAISRLPL
jgi:hypothetical protein